MPKLLFELFSEYFGPNSFKPFELRLSTDILVFLRLIFHTWLRKRHDLLKMDFQINPLELGNISMDEIFSSSEFTEILKFEKITKFPSEARGT